MGAKIITFDELVVLQYDTVSTLAYTETIDAGINYMDPQRMQSYY